MSAAATSYGQILRSSSIIGGAQVIKYVVGLVRVKIVAVLLGPTGIGLIGLYQSAVGLVGSGTGLGLNSSGVREVALAYQQGDEATVARTVHALRRACWATGALGWLAAIVLAVPLSQALTGSSQHAWAIAVLGGTLLLGAISGGQMALIQGQRRIGDIARVDVWAVLLQTILAVGLYWWLGEAGIVPVLVATALIALLLSFRYAGRIKIARVAMHWRETVRVATPLLRLGSAFMLSGLLAAGLDLLTRSVISQRLGIEATGIYQAAWALSGVFAAFILQAMGADFFPRLTAAIHDHAKAGIEVNQQTEIGILLALPGLVATMAFSPWVIHIFYTPEFAAASSVLAWMVLGVFGRVISWPLGYVMLALGAARWYAASEAIFVCLQAAAMFWLVRQFGVIGAAYAFALSYFAYVMAMLWTSRVLIGFRWSRSVHWLLVAASALVVASMLCSLLIPAPWQQLVGAALSLTAGVLSIRGLAHRLGPMHRLVRWLHRIPGHQWIIPR